ncbi:anaphase-promoting complex subunit 2 isoform X2 [Coccinella septempunctata]|uniref:anaphase-promoting complex subunit 2 isoform X2 n=1 Tax=Coccinella septempunctata TaxID=41139 RepID=UPI001D05C5A8|nr:anaphase-promoting complex subunit 2 isoform X2 [Coccinella septempunctata]
MSESGPQPLYKFKSFNVFKTSMFKTPLVQVEDGPEWLQVKKIFPIMNDDFSLDTELHDDMVEFENTIKLIKETWEVTSFVHHYFIFRYERFVRSKVIPEFIEKLEDRESNRFFEAVSFLYHHYQRTVKMVRDIFKLGANNGKPIISFSDNPEEAVRTKFSGSLYRLLQTEHEAVIKAYYRYDLSSYDSSNNTTLKCPNCEVEKCPRCGDWLEECSRKLKEMHVLHNILHSVILSLVSEYMDSRIKEICEGDLKESYIENLEKWLNEIILKWLSKTCALEEGVSADDKLQVFHRTILSDHLYSSYTKHRINQLFKIIIEYPDSLPVLQDIKEWLPKTNLRRYFIDTLKREMKTRLLHPGVGTSDILTAYVATIRALRVLDPSSQLLDAVTEPIHEYLRTRSDTVRCVVTSLTEEGPNDLAEELVSGEVMQPEEEDEDDWMNWVPPPKNPIPTESKTKSKSSDIITMLINVYGSKELFVNEYRTLLADRLLSQLSCDTEKEIRYLELLKLRFGDAQLNYCEVMLKDIVDSKRINQRIREDPSYNQEENFVSAMIVSAQFWPPFKDDRLELHPRVVIPMQRFTGSFEALKGNRTLLWKNHLGVVDLEIEIGNKKLELTVSPFNAIVLLYFEENTLSRRMVTKEAK